MRGLPGRLRATAPLVIAPLQPLGEDLQQPVEGVGLRLLAQALVRIRMRIRARARLRVRVRATPNPEPNPNLAVDGRVPEAPPVTRELAPHLVALLGADVAQDGGQPRQLLL